MKRFVIAFIFMALTVSAFFGRGAYCAEDGEGRNNIMAVKGRAAFLDWAASTIVVVWFNGIRDDELTIAVPSDANIIKDGGPIRFREIEESDVVRIEYYKDGPVGGLRAVTINAVSP